MTPLSVFLGDPCPIAAQLINGRCHRFEIGTCLYGVVKVYSHAKVLASPLDTPGDGGDNVVDFGQDEGDLAGVSIGFEFFVVWLHRSSRDQRLKMRGARGCQVLSKVLSPPVNPIV